MDDTRLPLTEHLAELRKRLLRAIVAIVIGAAACWAFREQTFAFLLRPALDALAPDGGRLQALAPGEIFFTYIKCSLLVGFVIALPVVFYEAWAFVAPGLYASEKKLAFPFVLVSTLLFVGGAAFGYYVVFPLMFTFFAAFENQYVEAAWTMREVFSFTVQMFLAFGVAFELPVAVFFLALAVNSYQFLQQLRGYSTNGHDGWR